MRFHDDDPPVDDGPADNWGGWRSRVRFHSESETAPLGGGPVDPIPVIDNPNAD